MSGGAPRVGYLGLGSNLGDRGEHIRAAVDSLPALGIEVEAVSSLYETEPVGEVLDQPDFLNAAARVRTALEPEPLLDACKEIEAGLGRELDGPRHAPRPVDVDVLLLGEIELRTERLTLPHPEVTSRRFVLLPLLELEPALALPDGTSLRASLDALGKGQRARRFGAIPSSRPGSGLSAAPAQR
jgi:2-amino-4-hydroxy-6-hydroxymethyldihydropteridine diphosphokinase